MDIRVQKYTISGLFSRVEGSFLGKEKIFAIPRFQREYSWSEKQWEEFSDDLTRALSKDDLDTDYWGNIIVYHSENHINIVDGQQRIVTLLLCLLALGENLVDNGRYPLCFDNHQQVILKKLLTNQSIDSAEKRQRLVLAKQFFQDRFRTVDREELVRFIYSTQITVVTVDNEFESHLLFGRINTRGLELHDVDLIKYLVFSTIDKQAGPSFNDEILETWREVQITVSSLNMSIERFVELYFYTNYKKTDRRLFNYFSDEIGDYKLFLSRLRDVAKRIKSWKDNSGGNDNKIGRNLRYLLKFGSDEAIQLIIKFVESPITHQAKFIELLTVYEFVRNISTFPKIFSTDEERRYWRKRRVDVNYDNVRESYYRFIYSERNDIQDIKEQMRKSLMRLDDFQRLFSELRYIDRSAHSAYRTNHEQLLSKYAIYTLNNWQDSYNHGAGETSRTRDDDDFSIEHILPKSFAINEDSIQYKIGNLLTFERIPNNDAGDKPLQDKLALYKKSAYPQVKELLYKKYRTGGQIWGDWEAKEFDEDLIEVRGNALATQFYKKLKRLLKE